MSATEESNFITWAREELRRSGLMDEESDYGGMLGNAVLDLCREFSDKGHSGNSAYMTLEIFARLALWKPLTPLTNDPGEWMYISEDMAGEPNCWQSKRSPSCFSNDGGKTYYDLDDDMSWWRKLAGRFTTYNRWRKRHTAQEADNG